MIQGGIEAFSGKRILLLQGPVGPFFSLFATDLRNVGAEVYKVNFNAGDWLFYPNGAVNYRGSMEEWPAEIERLLTSLDIDVVFLFGDCRPIHRMAHEVVRRLGIEIGVFEEGYIRPNFVTLERFGVNGYSLLPQKPEHYIRNNFRKVPKEKQVGKTYWAMAWWGFLYFTAGGLGKFFFPRYMHHRPLTILEALPWIRSVWRKYWYALKERRDFATLTKNRNRRFFLVPLQVYNDAQITEHSRYRDIESFITDVISSFARHAPKDRVLVFKHHPMDRGYKDYSSLIRKLSKREQLGSRVIYLHDQHLPTLLNHALGVVVINSTVGLSALHHGVPTKVCGSAIYALHGLTSSRSLDAFWNFAAKEKPDSQLYSHFREHLIRRTQLNGSFYRRLDNCDFACGIDWNSRPVSPEKEIDAAEVVVNKCFDHVIAYDEYVTVMH